MLSCTAGGKSQYLNAVALAGWQRVKEGLDRSGVAEATVLKLDCNIMGEDFQLEESLARMMVPAHHREAVG